MSSKYFLYIDILGFSDLVKSNSNKVDDLYQVIASLNVHDHSAFEAIIFSDTILIYNPQDPITPSDASYYVMFLCEFAQDLQHRLAGRDISFRALLTYGDFTHYTLNGIQCFFGQALIEAYHQEKRIQSVGLFIDHNCNKHNNYYQTLPFNDDFNFVFLTQALQRIEREYADALPVDGWMLEQTDPLEFLVSEIIMVQRIHSNMMIHEDERVREKYASAWGCYKQCYPKTLKILEDNNFNLSAISPSIDWKSICSRFPEDYSYILEN